MSVHGFDDPFRNDPMARRLARIEFPRPSEQLLDRILVAQSSPATAARRRTLIVALVGLVVLASLLAWRSGLIIEFVPTRSGAPPHGTGRIITMTPVTAEQATRIAGFTPAFARGSKPYSIFASPSGLGVFYQTDGEYIMVSEIPLARLGQHMPVPEGATPVVVGHTQWWISGSDQDVKTAVAEVADLRIQVHLNDIQPIGSTRRITWSEALAFLGRFG